MAKNTDDAKNNGGSPTACNKRDSYIQRVRRRPALEEKMALGLGV